MEQDEANSPRGRIALMKAVRDGFVEWDGSIKKSFDLCLGCRACEPACPAGVQYGALIEQTREAITEAIPAKGTTKAVQNVVFGNLFVEPKKMNGLVKLVSMYQKTGLQKVARGIGFMSLFPEHLRTMERALPAPAKPIQKLAVQKKSSLRVAFFVGCLMDTLFKETNEKTIALLEMLGVKVDIPDGQACCGALHGHMGQMESGHQNLQRNVDAFDSDDYDYIVNNAGGCGAFLKEYEKHLQSEPQYAQKAKRFSDKQIDISSLLVEAGLLEHLETVKSNTTERITYQDSCHLRNVNRVINPPRSILKSLPGAEYIEMPKADMCCGSAGIYNIIQPEMAGDILKTKMNHVQSVSPSYVITANPGCLMQMRAGIEREKLTNKMQAVHIVDFVYDKLHAAK